MHTQCVCVCVCVCGGLARVLIFRSPHVLVLVCGLVHMLIYLVHVTMYMSNQWLCLYNVCSLLSFFLTRS